MNDLIKHTDIPFLTTNSFEDVIRLRQETHAKFKSIKGELDELNKEVLQIMLAANVKAVAVGELIVKVIDSSSSRIDKNKLLDYGVEPTIISESTVRTEYSYLKVTI